VIPEPTNLELWRAEQTAERTARFLTRRPPVFAPAGELPAEAAAWLARYQAGATGSLVLVGPTGSGKTWTLWRLAETLIRSGWRGGFEIAPAYEVRRATDRPLDTDAIHRWRTADLWALDDLGSVSVTDWGADALLTIIDHRWQHQRPTLITTNAADLRSLLGDRVASRIADGATVAHITAPDRRRRNGASR
jgi:DNA replication protein DnaC